MTVAPLVEVTPVLMKVVLASGCRDVEFCSVRLRLAGTFDEGGTFSSSGSAA